jgi:hypothetical protein
MSPAEEKAPPMPNRSLDKAVNQARDLSPEPQVVSHDPARGAGAAVAAATFGAAAVVGTGVGAAAGASSGGGGGEGQRAVIIYDYEKAEDNEVELREGEYVTNIEFVDEDWWMGQNSQGESGLFPSNYVELIQDDGDDGGASAPPPLPTHPAEEEEETAPSAAPPAPSGGGAPTATAVYDYEAAEDNELSFPEGATITQVVSNTSTVNLSHMLT